MVQALSHSFSLTSVEIKLKQCYLEAHHMLRMSTGVTRLMLRDSLRMPVRLIPNFTQKQQFPVGHPEGTCQKETLKWTFFQLWHGPPSTASRSVVAVCPEVFPHHHDHSKAHIGKELSDSCFGMVIYVASQQGIIPPKISEHSKNIAENFNWMMVSICDPENAFCRSTTQGKKLQSQLQR